MHIIFSRRDWSTIFHVLGRLSLGIGVVMVIPLLVAGLNQEINPLYDFAIGMSIAVSLGISLMMFSPLEKEINWMHSFIIVSFGWILCSILGAIPLYLSKHYLSFIDAFFDAMSGFATTGLTLVQDLDHMSLAHNLWRHLTMFLGGQGIIVASLSLLSQARGTVVKLYEGEGRGEKILPNIIATARFIWRVSIIFLFLGVGYLFFILQNIGLPFNRALLHAICIFFAAFDTGGFAPQMQNIAYYHSFALEIGTMVLMILGAFNFNLHFWVWYRQRKELLRDFELRIFMVSIGLLTLGTYLFLPFKQPAQLFRLGFYQILSAHSGCGFTNLNNGQLGSLPVFPIICLIIAMMIGGSACSTTGGIKLIRMGIIAKAISAELKKLMLPLSAVIRQRYHHLQEVILNDRQIITAFIFTAVFMLSYFGGAFIGIFYGYPPLAALFESVSATANVGLSLGITSAQMPLGLKLIYILQMWLGRLEFFSVFVAWGIIYYGIRKK